MSKQPPRPLQGPSADTCTTPLLSCQDEENRSIPVAEEAAQNKGSHVLAQLNAAEDELVTWLQDPLELSPLESSQSSDIFPHWSLSEGAPPASSLVRTTASSAGITSNYTCTSQLITSSAFKYSPQPLQELPDWIHRDAPSLVSTEMSQSDGESESKGSFLTTSTSAVYQQSSSAHPPVWSSFNRKPYPTLQRPYLHLQAEGKLTAGLNSGQRRSHLERLPEGPVHRMVEKVERKGSTNNSALQPLPQGDADHWMNKESGSHMQIVGPFNCIADEVSLDQAVQSKVLASKQMPHIGIKGWLNKAPPWPSITSLSGSEERGNFLKQPETASKPSVAIGRCYLQTDVSNSAAEEALTLGAGRAAGIIEPSYDKAFSRVRTSLQPQQARLGSSCVASHASYLVPERKQSFSPMASNSPMLPPRIKAFGSYRDMLSSQPASRTDPKLPSMHSTNETTTSPGSGSQDSKQCTKFKTIVEGSSSKHGSLESSTTDVLASEESERVNPVIEHLQSDAEHLQKDVGAAVGSGAAVLIQPHEKKTECHDVHSGGSYTSENIREVLSSGKRKSEDSEGQSEEAEGESAMNSQTKRSMPKRTRANEIHNISERRRRTRINDKMNALRELIPSASKTNKAALLDEAIEYIKMLQLQLQQFTVMQVMSMRTGVSVSPAYPSGSPHVQAPINPAQSLGIGLSGGFPGGVAETIQNKDLAMAEVTYRAPTRPLLNLPLSLSAPTSSLPQFHPLSTTGSTPIHFPHPQQHQKLQMLKQQQLEQFINVSSKSSHNKTRRHKIQQTNRNRINCITKKRSRGLHSCC